ncbi:MAG TPA: hypothetical protein VFU71_07080, partial [Burkholderiaceae bacterium]|nr:hypothetical protein [Burkholderiaceae bacterium]
MTWVTHPLCSKSRRNAPSPGPLDADQAHRREPRDHTVKALERLALLEFARGPALIVAIAVFILGIAWRIYGIYRRPFKPDHSAPRATNASAPGLRAILSRMWHHRTFRDATIVGTLNAYGYHIGLAIVFFGFTPHIAFIRRLTGLSWPAVPGWLFVIAVAFVFIG